jgi:AcrR family transcriptional regulator
MTTLARRRHHRRNHGHHSRLPRAEREQQMLAAARALFAERGYGAVTMDDVAHEVGVTKPLLYNYFGNKERLYLACMEPAGDALIKAVIDAVSPTDTPEESLVAGMRAFFGFLAADRDAWRVLFDETLPASGDVAQRVADYRERLTSLVSQVMLAQLPPSKRDKARMKIEAVSTAVLGAAESLGRWWLRTDAIEPDAAADLLIATLGPGLREQTARRGGTARKRQPRAA